MAALQNLRYGRLEPDDANQTRSICSYVHPNETSQYVETIL